MRVTNSMLVSNFMNNLNSNLGRLDKYQTQLARNRKYAKISDDPVSVIYSMQARNRLRRLEEHQKSVEMAQSWNTQAETGLRSIDDVLQSAYETCIDAATNVKTDADRANTAQYIKQLRDHVLNTLNSTFGDRYVYAGYNTTGNEPGGELQLPFTVCEVDDTPPGAFEGDLIFNGVNLTQSSADDQAVLDLKSDKIEFYVGTGLTIEATVNGVDIVGTGAENIYNLLDNLYNEMISGATVEEIQAYIPKLQGKQSDNLAIIAELGGRTKRLEMLNTRYEQDYLNYTTMKSDAEDADQAELIMQYKMAQAVYQAALAAGASIIQPTLMDFLR